MAIATNRYEFTTIKYYGAVSAAEDPETIVRTFGVKTQEIWKKNGIIVQSNEISPTDIIISNVVGPRLYSRRELPQQIEGQQGVPRHYYVKETIRTMIITIPVQPVD